MNKSTHRLTVFVGDTGDDLAESALRHDGQAMLVSEHNYQDFMRDKLHTDTTIYTSLSDFHGQLKNFYDVLCSADEIWYHEVNTWSDGKVIDITEPSRSIQGLTQILLMWLPESINIHNLQPYDPLSHDPNPIVARRQGSQAQLWVAGCSISHGVGVDLDQRYGSLVAEQLQLPCSFLTRGGSCVEWAADQILRADIRTGDTVVWGLTNIERLTCIHQHRLFSLNGAYFHFDPEVRDKFNIDELSSENTLYRHLYSIQRVINFCKKIDVTLVLVGILPGAYQLLGHLRQLDNFIQIKYQLQFDSTGMHCLPKDTGTDGAHPGPVQHQAYAQLILNHLQRLQ